MKKALFAMCMVLSAVCLAFAAPVFKSMVTKTVLEKAVSALAEDFRRGEQSYVRRHGLPWAAGFYARHAVFEKEMGGNYDLLYASLAANFNDPEDYWVKEGGAKEAVMKLRESIMKTAREALGDPDALRGLYVAHKGDIISLIKRHGIAEKLKAELVAMLPYFEKNEKNRQLASRELDCYEWVARRRAEGGQQLVDMWAWIARDIISAP